MEKNRNTILAFYAVLSLVVLLCSTTSFNMQNMGYTLVMIELVIAYIARAKFPRNESYEENHTTFIIRTIWVYTTLAAIGMIGAAIIVTQRGSMDAMHAMTEALMSGAQPSEEQMNSYAQQYISDNEDLLRNQFRMWLFPAQLYLVWRILKGGERAFKSYRIANPKRWL